MRNRPLDLRIPRSDALPLSHRDAGCGEQGPLRSSYITSVLYAARISNVDNVMSMFFLKNDLVCCLDLFFAKSITDSLKFLCCSFVLSS